MLRWPQSDLIGGIGGISAELDGMNFMNFLACVSGGVGFT
jgi:hypothetical protein